MSGAADGARQDNRGRALKHYTARYAVWGEGPPLVVVPGLAGGFRCSVRCCRNWLVNTRSSVTSCAGEDTAAAPPSGGHCRCTPPGAAAQAAAGVAAASVASWRSAGRPAPVADPARGRPALRAGPAPARGRPGPVALPAAVGQPLRQPVLQPLLRRQAAARPAVRLRHLAVLADRSGRDGPALSTSSSTSTSPTGSPPSACLRWPWPASATCSSRRRPGGTDARASRVAGRSSCRTAATSPSSRTPSAWRRGEGLPAGRC